MFTPKPKTLTSILATFTTARDDLNHFIATKDQEIHDAEAALKTAKVDREQADKALVNITAIIG